MLAMELLVPDILDPRIPVQRSAQSIGTLWITKILSTLYHPINMALVRIPEALQKILIILHV